MNDFVTENWLRKYTGSDPYVVVPDGITHIDDQAFPKDTISVELPQSIEKISLKAFVLCEGLESISIRGESPIFHVEGNCLIETAEKVLFAGCVKSVIPADESVYRIGEYAFAGRRKLTSLIIPKNIKQIAKNAFQYCYGLTQVDLPASLKSTIRHSFRVCPWAAGACFDLLYKEEKQNYLFKRLQGYKDPFEDTECVETYLDKYKGELLKVALADQDIEKVLLLIPLWKKPFSIREIDSFITLAEGNVTALAWLLEYKKKHYSPEQIEKDEEDRIAVALGEKERTLAEWRKIFLIRKVDGGYEIGKYKGDDREVYIPAQIDGVPVVSIGKRCFYAKPLTLVNLPDSIVTIHKFAFQRCQKLFEVNLPKELQIIEDFAFAGTGLEDLFIPAKVISIAPAAFGNCLSLTSITADENNPYFHAVNNCLIDSDKRIVVGCQTSVIPDDGSVTGIGCYAFYGCETMSSIVIPANITRIERWALHLCGFAQFTIIYHGTREDWIRIKKGVYWANGYTTIHCIEGDL